MLRTPTEPLATAYMHQMLDRLPFVARYAWFTDDCWNHPECRFESLLNARGLVTSAGRMFSTAP